MSEKTNIEWCDSTINGSSGCDGCELWTDKVRSCYAGNLQERRFAKTMPEKYAADFKEVRLIPGRFAQAAHWKSLRGTKRPDKPWLDGLPRCIFVGDMGDFLSQAVDDEYLRLELLAAMTSEKGRRHFWMLLTKRPSRLLKLALSWGGLPNNCMAMTTVTGCAGAEARLRALCAIPCRWRGVSAEPLLGPVELPESAMQKIHLVIAGGESGGEARPMHPRWVRSLATQCVVHGAPFFFKQWGCWVPVGEKTAAELPPKCKGHRFEDDTLMLRAATEKTGAHLEGREWREFPAIGAVCA